MASFNKVILLGNLTRDPELRSTNSGVPVCRIGIATSRVIRGSDGENRDEVVFVDVDTYGKQAEVIGRYFTKGRPIFIEGRLRLDQWESSTGEKRSKLCVILESFQFVGSARFDDDGGGGNFGNASIGASQTETRGNRSTSMDASANDMDDDVPF